MNGEGSTEDNLHNVAIFPRGRRDSRNRWFVVPDYSLRPRNAAITIGHAFEGGKDGDGYFKASNSYLVREIPDYLAH